MTGNNSNGSKLSCRVACHATATFGHSFGLGQLGRIMSTADQVGPNRNQPDTGQVTGWIDLAELKSRMPPVPTEPLHPVMNGIAYDATGRRLFVTGKLKSRHDYLDRIIPFPLLLRKRRPSPQPL